MVAWDFWTINSIIWVLVKTKQLNFKRGENQIKSSFPGFWTPANYSSNHSITWLTSLEIFSKFLTAGGLYILQSWVFSVNGNHHQSWRHWCATLKKTWSTNRLNTSSEKKTQPPTISAGNLDGQRSSPTWMQTHKWPNISRTLRHLPGSVFVLIFDVMLPEPSSQWYIYIYPRLN